MRPDEFGDLGPEGPRVERSPNGVRQLWSLCLLWCALAAAAGFASGRVSGGWRASLVVLTVLFAVLGVWFGLFATLGGLIRRAADGRPSLSRLVPWWVWAPLSLAVGALAGTAVYVDGLADLIAIPLVLVGIGAALARRSSMSSVGRRRMWACLALIGTSAVAVGLSVFL